MAFVHAPKTIDNDLVDNDHTPGFISAGEFVAAAFLSVDLDFRALPGVYVGIVMGRHAGFLTAAAATWRLDGDSGPHLIYVPERGFSVPRFIDDVRKTLDRHKRCIVAVSEGVSTEDGRSLVESLVPADRLERDAHGNVKLSGTDLGAAFEQALAEGLPGKRARVDTLGYMPRGAISMISPVDAREAFDAGAFAVEAAGKGGGSVALQVEKRQDGDPAGAAVQRRRQDTPYAGRFPESRTRTSFRKRALPISRACCRRSSRSASRSCEPRRMLRVCGRQGLAQSRIRLLEEPRSHPHADA